LREPEKFQLLGRRGRPPRLSTKVREQLAADIADGELLQPLRLRKPLAECGIETSSEAQLVEGKPLKLGALDLHRGLHEEVVLRRVMAKSAPDESPRLLADDRSRGSCNALVDERLQRLADERSSRGFRALLVVSSNWHWRQRPGLLGVLPGRSSAPLSFLIYCSIQFDA
jgi:hypothetical protein